MARKKTMTAEAFAEDVLERMARNAYGQPQISAGLRGMQREAFKAFFVFHCGSAFAEATNGPGPRKANKEKPPAPAALNGGGFQWIAPLTAPAPGGYARPLNADAIEGLKRRAQSELAKVGCAPELIQFEPIDDETYGRALRCTSRPAMIEDLPGQWDCAVLIRDGKMDAAKEFVTAALIGKGVAELDVTYADGPAVDAGPTLLGNGVVAPRAEEGEATPDEDDDSDEGEDDEDGDGNDEDDDLAPAADSTVAPTA